MKKFLMFLMLSACFSAPAQTVPDTAGAHQGSVQKVADSLSANPGATGLAQAQKIKIIKKELDFSTSIKLAIGMMVFIALILFTAQSWNPGGVNQ